MSQRNYLYELEKFLKEYGHNEELSILTACQKASMSNQILKKSNWDDPEGADSYDSDEEWDAPEVAEEYTSRGGEDQDFSEQDISEKKIDIPSGFCDSWAYTGSSLALTIIGLLPKAGIPFDMGNAILNIHCGDYVYALLSFVAAIPLVGYIGNALKVAFAAMKGTLKGGPALVKIISGAFKGTKVARQAAYLNSRSAKLLDEMTEITTALAGTSDDMAKLLSKSEVLKDLGAAEKVLKILYSTKNANRIKEVAELEKKITELRKIEDSISAAKQVMRDDWSYFTKSFFEVLKDSGQFSKLLGVSNMKLRSFMRWTKDIFYQVEEQVIGFDDNVREYRIGD